ncbi:unnamed protein product [Camellia sinensis]
MRALTRVQDLNALEWRLSASFLSWKGRCVAWLSLVAADGNEMHWWSQLCCCGLLYAELMLQQRGFWMNGHYTTRRQLFAGTENNAPSSIETTDAEGSQKRQCTSVSADNGTVSTPSTEILREENLEEKSIENKCNIKRQYIPKVKKELDLPRRSSKRLEELKLKTVVNCVLSEQAHGAATGKSGETEVKPLQTISTQITDHDLRGTELSDINEKALEDRAVPEDQPARPETEMKDQENLGSEVNPSGDSWSDPCLEFAFKTLTGALVVENNVATTQGYFQNKSTPLVLKTDGSLALPEFGMPYLPNFFQSNISPGFDAPGGKHVSVPQLPMNPTYVPPGQPNLGGNNEHQPRVNSCCCRMWSKIEKWIATLEFDRDRKSMGVRVSSSSGRKPLLVKRLVISAIAAGLGALTHTLGTLVPVIGANGFATATAATAIGTIVGSFR